MKLLIMIITVFLLAFSLFAQAEKGKISGTVLDSETGDPLIGANIYLNNTSLGSASDLDGRYVILNIPTGSYTLVVSVIGYAETRIQNVEVEAGEITKMDVALRSEILTSDVVVVEAKAIKNTEAALLKSRQKSLAVSDAVSAEAISRAGSDNAAQAMRQVTGASVVDGKYVYVRGLGDRYTSTQLNGAEIPSTDPYKRAGSIDLIPTNLIDNIQTIKSFTPDKPGNFSGGTVDIKTKDFPDELNFSVSTSAGYNSLTTFNSNGPLTYQGGSTDWLGMDDGTRALPTILEDRTVTIPNVGEAGQDLEKAQHLDNIVKSFTPVIEPKSTTPSINQNYSLSLGNQFNLFDRPLGFLASLSYRRDVNSYDNGQYQRWVLSQKDASGLINDYNLKDAKTVDEVLWGALIKTSYKLTNNHVLSFNGMYNQNGQSEARYLEGKYPYDLDPTSTWRGSVLSYNERTLKSAQFDGDHNFPSLFGARLDWKFSYSSTNQDEPDLRYFNSFETNRGLYGIKSNIAPARYWRFMDEDRREVAANLSFPFKQWNNQPAHLKIGGLIANKNRTYHERHFEYTQNPTYNYQGSTDTLFAENNVGLIDTTKRTIGGVTYKRYDFGLVLRENYYPEGTYDGAEDISAAYLMLELPLTKKLRFIGGARYETTEMSLITGKKDLAPSEYNTDDILPSANLIYGITENMNVRVGYNRTLARPLFREVAPYASWDFQGGDTYIGNPELKRTLIDNADIRWEWFSRPGEIYAVSAFWKTFKDPIEVVFNNFGENTWMNADKAEVLGLELEARKKLDIISPYLSNFSLGTNLSLVQSEVTMPDTVLFLRRITRPDAPSTRAFQGQSPYLLNVSFTYDNFESGMVASLYYNIFGERLYKVSLGGTPDIYEQPFGLLNFSFSWRMIEHLKFTLRAENILDSEVKRSHEYKGVEYIQQLYNKGRSFSIGIGYTL